MGETPARRILVVDDEKDVLKVSRILLEKEGYSVETAQSGDEAREAARAGGVSLIVVDITMPGLDAYALCEGLAAEEVGSLIPLLVIADREEAARRLIEKARAPADFITKPVKKETLIEKVKSLLERSGELAAQAGA
jgi:CheY-like chemotaxis protein